MKQEINNYTKPAFQISRDGQYSRRDTWGLHLQKKWYETLDRVALKLETRIQNSQTAVK